MKWPFSLLGGVSFGVSAFFAIEQKWSLPEFCWSTWLAGLVYAWVSLVGAVIQVVLTARANRPLYEGRFPFLRRLPAGGYWVCVGILGFVAGVVGFRISCFLFGFYGLFLSVFAEMEPMALFGRNGFINSDFFTPVCVLLDRFWPMALGAVVAGGESFVRVMPVKRILLPIQKEVLRLHLLVLTLPILSAVAWRFLGESYQSAVIVLLMGLFYWLPTGEDGREVQT